MTYYTVTLGLSGALSAAVAVEWTNHPAPLDSGRGWEPCLRLADGSWRFASHDPAVGAHRRGLGPFAGLAIRYRLDPAGPWSAAAEPRKDIVIEPQEGGPQPVPPLMLAAPALVGGGAIGTELAVEPGLWSGAPAPALAFQWRRDGADVPGAAARAYLISPLDDGCALACAVTARNAAGVVVATAGPVAARYPAPRRVGDLPEEVFDEGTGPQAVETAFAFAGEALVFSAKGAAIDPRSGVVTIPTDAPIGGAVVRVTVSNSGGSAAAELQYTVEASQPAVPPTAIEPADVALLPFWVDPTKRTLVAAEVEVAGVGAGDALQWRIDTARVNGAWQDCPVVSGTRRALATAARPAHLPGDHPLGHFDDDEERFAIRFRKKIGANAWSEPTPKLRLDPPGAFQPSVTVRTAQQLRDAIIAGTERDVTQHYVIHVAADISFSGQSATMLSLSNRNKQGRSLVIRSSDLASPRTFRSWRGEFMALTNCSNIVIQGLRWENDQTESAGGETHSGVKIPFADVNTGTAIKIDNCQKLSITDCVFHKHKFGVATSRITDFYLGFCEFSGTSNDSVRLLGGGLRTSIESCYFHSQEPHPDSNMYDHNSNAWHTDCLQAGHHSTWGGHKNLHVRNCRAYGVGTFSGFVIVEGSSSFMYEDTFIEGCFYRGTSQSGISLRKNRNTVIANCVIRETSPLPRGGTKKPRVRIGNVTENIVLRDVVTAYPWITQEENAGGGEAAIQAQVTEENVVTSKTAWPTAWPAGATEAAREAAYPAGPDAYRFERP